MSERSNSWFIITTPLAPAYAAPGFNSSKVTEVVGGESVQVLQKKGDWLFVEQDDGYQSWIKEFYGCFGKVPFAASHMIIESGKIPFGTRVQKKDQNIVTADGTSRLAEQELNSLTSVAKPDEILSLARGLLGSPYRWGGKTSFGFDCSGFVQMVCLAAGILLPRDSWQQRSVLNDYAVDGGTAGPGDLHFFGKNDKVTHVGFSTGGQGVIHCQGFVKEETIAGGRFNSNKKLADIYMSTHSIRRKFRA